MHVTHNNHCEIPFFLIHCELLTLPVLLSYRIHVIHKTTDAFTGPGDENNNIE